MAGRGSCESDRVVGALRATVLALGVLLVVLAGWVIVARFRYPIDAEWMTGAVRDGVERVRRGEPLYAAPSAEFIPFLYPPLFDVAAAFLARLVSTFVACKLVSIASTVTTLVCTFALARRLGASRFWTCVAPLLYVGTYQLGLFFFDLERVDAFAVTFAAIGTLLLLTRESRAQAALAGAIVAAGFFAKQPVLLVFLGIFVGVVLARQRGRALAFGLAGGTTLVVLGSYLDLSTGGWFRHYVLALPRAHGVRPQLLSVFFVVDMPKAFALSAGSIAFLAGAAQGLRARPSGDRASNEPTTSRRADDLIFAGALLGAMIGAFLGRAHQGGWPNVLIGWLPFACVAVAVMASRFEERARTQGLSGAASLVLGAVALQLLGGVFDPTEIAPNGQDLEERTKLLTLVHSLEERGPVLATAQGDLTHPSSVHAGALYDILRAGERAPEDLRDAIEARRYAAILTWSPFEPGCEEASCTELVALTTRNYFIAARRREPRKTSRVGFDAWAEYVLLPRAQPLETLSESATLQRIRIEVEIASLARASLPESSDVLPDRTLEARGDEAFVQASRNDR